MMTEHQFAICMVLAGLVGAVLFCALFVGAWYVISHLRVVWQ